jgi:SIT4-associating protein SAP185/190
MKTTQGEIRPLTLERFRICELYAELLHCSNMGLLNRQGTNIPRYDERGLLEGGLESLDLLEAALAGAAPVIEPVEEEPSGSFSSSDDESVASAEARPASPASSTYRTPDASAGSSLCLAAGLEDLSLGSASSESSPETTRNPTDSPVLDRTTTQGSVSNVQAQSSSSPDEPTTGHLVKTRFLHHQVHATLVVSASL